MRILTIILLIIYGILCFVGGYQYGNSRAVFASTDYREFPSVEAFQEWGQAQPLLGKSGQIGFIDPDCDKQAEYLQRRALNEGYLVSQQIVNKNGYIANTYVAFTKDAYHMGLITTIGNYYYYMDSFTREVVRIQLVRD